MVGDDEGEYVPPPRNGIAAFDGGDARLASFTETSTRPSNLAVGEGSLWALGLDGKTVMRVDPATREVERRFTLNGGAASIAAGAGAVWLDGDARLRRMDPRTGAISSTTKLPSGGEYPGDVPAQNWGYPQVAVGAGAVWVDQRRPHRVAHRPHDRQACRQDPGGRASRSRPAGRASGS